ncbi:MAG TPA: pilus assembly protein TadG-related protein [Rhizomicrobium sp.]|nr:pilus assembly protein TadG-related protein [Rhizomicrobium sp.]
MHDTMTAIFTRARTLLRGFVASRRGNVAMMFGIALVPLMIATGVGLDYARAALVKSQIADALDAAALAVGSSGLKNQEDVRKAAQAYFDANYKGPGTVAVNIQNYDAKGSITLGASADVSTQFLKVADVPTIGVGTSSTVVWGQSRLWVALVLDNSTSMNDGSRNNTKMQALQAASKNLLTKLQSASSTDGDVQVGIVPFTRVVNVGTANAAKSWVYWGYWEAPPANATLGSGTDSNGPGVNCPFSDNSQGYHCLSSSTNNSGSASKIPSSGLICPSIDNGRVNTDHNSIYYNGCWTSTATRTKTVTTTKTQPQNVKQSCTQKGNNAESCTNNGNPQNNGNSTTNNDTSYANGYSGDSTNSSTVTNKNANSQSDGSKSCSGSGNNKTCTWTRTFTQNQVTTTTVKSGSDFSHAWQPNQHTSWNGCILDRAQDDDISNTAPAGTHGFPAVNPDLCFSTTITPLGYSWTNLASQITNMTPNGYTNQPIGVAHGWQMLTPGDPWDTPAVPANTSRYIILFSDGLNTQDRWYVSSNTNVGDTRVDARLVKADASKPDGVCDKAKADGIIIYSVYIHLAGDPADSASMKNCATDLSKYFNLTSADQISTAFDTIAEQITNVRVSQ